MFRSDFSYSFFLAFALSLTHSFTRYRFFFPFTVTSEQNRALQNELYKLNNFQLKGLVLILWNQMFQNESERKKNE